MAFDSGVRARLMAGFGLTGLVIAVAASVAMAVTGVPAPLALARLLKHEVVEQPVAAGLASDDLASAGRLGSAFARLGYSLDGVASGHEVPRVFVPAVPADLAALPEIDAKKDLFLRVMLPLVLLVNEEVAADRRRLLAISARKATGQPLSRADEAWLAELTERYGAEGKPLSVLLRRVDTVAPSLALAQAAEESGWGTSRVVRKGRNLFGQIADDDGRLATFGSLHEAVRAYIHNLNTHRAYEPLRRARAAARARGLWADGLTLAGALTSYSERGTAYVDNIRALIRRNDLARFDNARLGKSPRRPAVTAPERA
ncbi:MAG: glucosaminidase domain-containing protein [Solirubrobacterales bacterium]